MHSAKLASAQYLFIQIELLLNRSWVIECRAPRPAAGEPVRFESRYMRAATACLRRHRGMSATIGITRPTFAASAR
jgi:hypothetical protein